MNKCLKNLNRIEFVVTNACTGKCKHCSEGVHKNSCESINKELAAQAVRKIAERYNIQSVMTFGGEPLLYADVVCKIHSVAKEMNILRRQLITNGYFSNDFKKIHFIADKIAESGINDILLSVDAFHQETIPLEYVKEFAAAVKNTGVPLRVHPAWLISCNANNQYNKITKDILSEFALMGIDTSDGNVIFPSGNAVKYLIEYFDENIDYPNPYEVDPYNISTISFSPNGDVLNDNVYKKNIIDILNEYNPENP